MNLFVKAAIVAATLGASAAASADQFDFSYVFADNQEVSGSFTGTTANGGQSVSNVSNFQVSLNGIAFAPVSGLGNATLVANNWNPILPGVYGGTGNYDDTTPVTIYANGALNNFAISDVDAAINTSPDYEFAMTSDATNNIYQVVAANFLQSDSFNQAEGNPTQLAIDAPVNASGWKLTDVAPVPVPAALPLLLSGLGLLGFGRRRSA